MHVCCVLGICWSERSCGVVALLQDLYMSDFHHKITRVLLRHWKKWKIDIFFEYLELSADKELSMCMLDEYLEESCDWYSLNISVVITFCCDYLLKTKFIVVKLLLLNTKFYAVCIVCLPTKTKHVPCLWIP